MSLAMELFEHEGQRRAGRDRERLLQLEHRAVRLSLGGMDTPSSLLVPVKRVFDGPAGLVEVRGRIHQRHSARLCRTRFKQHYLKIAEMQIAVVLPARSVLGQRRVRQHFEAYRCESRKGWSRRDRVGVAL